jgi:Gram-negative bacterial TonB protein C-terminal
MMASAEGLARADPKHYVWWFPGSPVKVHLDLGVVERLQDRLQRTGNPVAEQGLLFGRVHEGITEICDFQAVPGGNLQEMAAASARGQGQHLLVGYYRSQQEATLRLNENDLFLAEALFTEPFHVFLVIQSTGFAPANASFFFRAGGRLRADFPIMEFPFDAPLLIAEERNKTERSRPAVLERPVVVPPTAAPVPARAPVPVRKRRTRILSRIAWLCFAVCILAAAALLAWRFFPEIVSLSRRAPPVQPLPATPPQASIGLNAQRQNGDVVLTWNRQSAPIASATSGVLFIQDGEATRQVSLDAAQVRGGSILYSPATNQVQMRLTVTGPAGATTESVIVLLPKSGPPQVRTFAPPNPSPAPTAHRDAPETTSQLSPLKPFAAPDARRAARPSSPAAIDDPPPPSLSPNLGTAAPAVFPGPHPAVPPPPGPAKQSAQQQPTPQAAPVYQQPVAINKVMPEFPSALRAFVFKPVTVEIRVTIDKDGKVVKAEPIPQKDANRLMVDAAAYAAQLWKFRPALNGDQPVTSETVLQFIFKR